MPDPSGQWRPGRPAALTRTALGTRLPHLLLALVVAATVLHVLVRVYERPALIRAWEVRLIALAIAQHHGYSFPGYERWLFDPVNDGSFHATAWVEPIYTCLLGALAFLFKDHDMLAGFLANCAMLAAALWLTFKVAERLVSPWYALVAVVLLAVCDPYVDWTSQLNSAIIAQGALLVIAWLYLRAVEAPGAARAGALGLGVGLGSLTFPSVQLAPVAAGALLLPGWGALRERARLAAIVLVVVALTISPWAIRTYVLFGELVPGRTGGGQIAFVGTVALAETIQPGIAGTSLSPPWTAPSPRVAVALSGERERLLALESFEIEYARRNAPPEYAGFGEAQRDRWLQAETIRFIRNEPLLIARLAVWKLERFVRILGRRGIALTLLAVAGSLIGLRDVRILGLSAFALAYVLPFTLIICYYTRYRAPVEPLFAILAMVAVSAAASRVRSLAAGRGRPGGPPAPSARTAPPGS